MSNVSRFARYRYFRSDVDEDRFLIDFPTFFILIVASSMGALLAITALQADITSRAYIVAQQQLLMLIVAITLIVFVNLYRTDRGEARFDVRWMTRDEAVEAGVFMMLAFAVARIMAAAVSLTMDKLYDLQLQLGAIQWNALVITYTSAIFEELVFGVGMTTGAYLLIYKFVDMVTGNEFLAKSMAIMLAPAFVGVFFAQIHIGVYGTDPALMGYLFGARYIYSLMYIVTRNALVNTGAHLLHNMTLAVI